MQGVHDAWHVFGLVVVVVVGARGTWQPQINPDVAPGQSSSKQQQQYAAPPHSTKHTTPDTGERSHHSQL